MIYCADDRHGTPCPSSCDDCNAECDPSQRVEANSPIEAARAAGWRRITSGRWLRDYENYE